MFLSSSLALSLRTLFIATFWFCDFLLRPSLTVPYLPVPRDCFIS